jgi:hypothetical protein
MDTRTKQPRDQLDFDVTYADWLPKEAIIQTVEVTVDVPEELTLLSYQNNSPIIKVWLADGLDGKTYKITVKAATDLGQIKEKEFRLRVKEL